MRQTISSYFLPQDLPDGTVGVLKSRDYGSVVIDVNGVEWRVSDRCVEYEYEYEIRNRWLPATDPRVIAYKTAWAAGDQLTARQILEGRS